MRPLRLGLGEGSVQNGAVSLLSGLMSMSVLMLNTSDRQKKDRCCISAQQPRCGSVRCTIPFWAAMGRGPRSAWRPSLWNGCCHAVRVITSPKGRGCHAIRGCHAVRVTTSPTGRGCHAVRVAQLRGFTICMDHEREGQRRVCREELVCSRCVTIHSVINT